MKYLMLMFKGFIIGTAKIIPGVSGAIIAISFGIYEKLISIISKPTKITLENLKFLFFILVGAVLGIGLLCKGVKWCLDTYYFPTMLLFAGLIIGGISDITKNIKKEKFNYKFGLIFVICFTLLYFLVNIKGNQNINSNNYIIYFLIGIIESLTTIIPGISGTAIFMALGWYELLLTVFEEISTFSINLYKITLFLGGFIICTILISKIITWLFENKKTFAYTGVLGFMCCSLVIMLIDACSHLFSISEFIIGIFLFIIGFWGTRKINTFFSKL